MADRDLTGKVALVTGANTGIGAVTARVLAERGAGVILACRTRARAQPVLDTIAAAGGDAHFVELDLGSLASVRACAAAVLARDEPLHLLINNAGLAGHRGVTADGFEIQFGVNHLGHFLLTMLLVDRLKASAPARIVNVASIAHYKPRAIDYAKLRQKTPTTVGVKEYEVSKLANVLFTAELARRLRGTGVTNYALHPGVIASDVWRRIPWPIRPLVKRRMITVEKGALTTLHCATAPLEQLVDGGYYDRCAEREPNPAAKDEAAAAELWRRSLEWGELSSSPV